MNEIEATIILNMLSQVGGKRFLRLFEYFGSAVQILEASWHALKQVHGIGDEIAQIIISWKEKVNLDEELEIIEKKKARVILQNDSEYPPLLKKIVNPPILLYIMGHLKKCDHDHALAIVGTRQPTFSGAEGAKRLSYQLAYAGLTIYSGLARGIDTMAHQAALAANGRTVAVLGSGLNSIYPPENIPLFEKIISGSGAVISEFPMNLSPNKLTFPQRNRIISGSSLALLVIEASLRSGALITAKEAEEEGRTIYALPGSFDKKQTQGSNRLIQQGAKLVLDAQDILNDLPFMFPTATLPVPSKNHPLLVGHDLIIYNSMSDEPMCIDEIIEKSNLAPEVVSSRLLALELESHVLSVGGGYFAKLL